uniref:DUF3085 domain-containing protein n=1 Tax=Loa loa TaxID=7209 RepID=A0A1I7V695_LOALO
MISNDLKNTDEGDESEALDAAKKIRGKIGSAPICIVDQPDNRKAYINAIGVPKALLFYGPDEELLFLNSHQAIAFHFTVVNSTEPEDSEEIFSNTFPDIPLSTLRLLDESSLTGVDYQIETKSDFYIGPVYAIVGFRKFVEENP